MSNERPRFNRLAPSPHKSETSEERAAWLKAVLTRSLEEKRLTAATSAQPAEPPPLLPIVNDALAVATDTGIPPVDGPPLTAPADKLPKHDIFAGSSSPREVLDRQFPVQEIEERGRERKLQIFFRGYTDESFGKKDIEGGRRKRIIANTSKEDRRQVFQAIMRGWGRVTQASSTIYVDIYAPKVNFMNEPLLSLLRSDEDFAIYFAGAWLAKGLPNQLRISRPRLALELASRLKASSKLPMVQLEDDNRTLNVLYINMLTIPKLKEILSDVLPVDILFQKSRVLSNQ